MAAEEEDEVDVLGDFSLDNLLSKEDGRLGSCYVSGVFGSQGAELLNCDYNIGSNWLLDASNQSCWYTSNDESKPLDRQQFGFASGLSKNVSDSLPSTSQWEEGDKWSDKEKSLLEEGKELFGQSWSRLSQFIGSKTPQQVKSYVTSQNLQLSQSSESLVFDTSPPCDPEVFSFSELIDDIQIPASMEEVIAVVSTAQPTVPAGGDASEGRRRRGAGRCCRVRGRRGPMQPGRRGGQPRARPAGPALQPARAVPQPLSSGEEVVRIRRESSSDSDSDVEIEVADPSDSCVAAAEAPALLEAPLESEGELPPLRDPLEALEAVLRLPAPCSELRLEPGEVTAQERAVHADYFDGRTTKTPKRYLKIRNHILECWRHNRPAYVTKTLVRAGLKHCGDVNRIGRIHAYLEHIGAINFGCEQTRYGAALEALAAGRQRRPGRETGSGRARRGPRSAQRLPVDWGGPRATGGYTIVHGAGGDAVLAPGGHRRAAGARAAAQPAIRLLPCRRFSEQRPAPFCVQLSATALLTADLHAHSGCAEVAGLLGGRFSAGQLQVVRAVACRTAAASGVHCDICPVSQTEASERLRGAGLQVVGWYHSHPTFLPDPSLQDLCTQRSMQQWFARTGPAPIVCFILAPYCPSSPSPASLYRCVTVQNDDAPASSVGSPYALPVCMSAQGLSLPALERDLAAVCALVRECPDSAVDFGANCRLHQGLSNGQKCVESARLHLAAADPPAPDALRSSALQTVARAVRVCAELGLASAAGSEPHVAAAQ